jgi:uncharacterized protein YkwD
MKSLSLHFLTLASAVALSGCPGGGGSGNTGTINGRSVLATGPGYRAPAQADYAPDPSLAPYFASAAASAQRSQMTLLADRGLVAAASVVAARIAADSQHRQPSARALQSIVWSAGVLDPLPLLTVLQKSGGEITPAELGEDIARVATGNGFNRIGIARTQSGGVSIVTALLSRRLVTFAGDVPARAPTGSRVQLRGELLDGLHNPELALTNPAGHGERFALGDGPSFLGQFRAESRGLWQLELLAEGRAGVTVVANFPVYVDIEPSASVLEVAQTVNESPAQVSERLLQRINQARAARGRRALLPMPALAEVARAHSQDMAEHRFFAHNGLDARTPGDRIRAAGIQTGVVLENIATGISSDEIHSNLMDSPGHRANIENERITHVGVGVVPNVGAVSGFVATEDFIEVAAAVDTSTAPQRLLERINQTRQRRSVNPLQARPQLTEAASHGAQTFFARPTLTQAQVVQQVNNELSRVGLMFRRIEVLATVVSNLEDASGLEPLFQFDIAGIGIGISQGSRPGVPPNSIFIVFVLGYPH